MRENNNDRFGAEYSPKDTNLSDEDYFDPTIPPINNNIYHLSKHLISRLHLSSSLKNIYNFRVFGLYGPYEDHTRRLISNNIFNFLNSGYMTATANHSFDYLYVDDLISAVLHLPIVLHHPLVLIMSAMDTLTVSNLYYLKSLSLWEDHPLP